MFTRPLSGTGSGPGAHMHRTDEVWHDDASQEAIENWPDRPFDPPRMCIWALQGYMCMHDSYMYSMSDCFVTM
ncbi:hypothetical protein HanRHA438_Chr05g0213731 [Helianthus annuus]|uniref:Uncharacterized protein n=1 Tax=Helianthus annuus TaxID=4232 RepID=A0A9K3NLT8_HELAN|nr:hypothetical protein HanXRQr2_Chr05g0203901 [Helianthus annuus]KAJ0569544.1 hypothetical protein HanHA300_Chr05g0167421 [Helianthus annuus]KAJ0583854.1 hypothetical protein HanHA89_Chr05g0181481 [Helianthus annuus]KAJ0788751.1 hypothetical protein HanPI659440_Chr05g0195531 [Helianthus annuus]KAJ0918100.1 hypothetical protein HanRHA438_Chr05g0213731 [Helianthus annuus]